jgi:predicted transglutaminase-like cysteine proteinase
MSPARGRLPAHSRPGHRARVRQILGVLALSKKHGDAVVDDATKAAVELGVLTYRFVRTYVERRRPCR